MTKNLGIVAATVTGNRGAEAMLLSVAEQTFKKYPGAQIHILSYSPAEDLEWINTHTRLPRAQVSVHSSTPLQLVLNWFPLALLLKVFPFFKKPISKDHYQSFRSLCHLDGVVDLAGVSFMDSRLKFLPFNILTIWPWTLHKVPVFKLAQALGPFTNWLNHFFAKNILEATSLTVTRGSKTAENLLALQLAAPTLQAPDTAFTLTFKPKHLGFETRQNRVLLMPSSLMHKKHPAYLELLTQTAKLLRARGIAVDLMAHSWKTGTEKLRNNDWPLCLKIHQDLGAPADMRMFGPELDAVDLKEIVSDYAVSVTSRFHGMVAALDTQTPVWVIGWSHKYQEILKEFDLENHALPYEKLSAEGLTQTLSAGLASASAIAAQITTKLPRVRAQSSAQFVTMFDILENSQKKVLAHDDRARH